MRGLFSLDTLRLFLAFAVATYHIDVLTGQAAFKAVWVAMPPALAVSIFFVLSGALVSESYRRNPSNYLAKRARRVLPGYAATVLLCGLLATSLADFWGYVGPNLLLMNFLAPSIPGVFEQGAVSAVNGSLWTIKIEVGFYLLLPALVWLHRRFGAPVLWALGAASLAFRLAPLPPEIARQLPGQLWLFLIGMGLVRWLPKTERLPVDLSFALYLVHYPVAQVLIAAGVTNAGMLLLAALLASAALHFGVERPALHIRTPRRLKAATA